MRKNEFPVAPRILIADETRDLADVYAFLFSAAGYRVSRAYEGHTAAAIAKVTKPDVAILNQYLPGQSGLDVMQELRAASVSTKVIITGGAGDFAGLARRALAEGAEFCVRQPCHAEQLLRMVSSVLARPRGFSC